MAIEFSAKTDVGNVRTNNEDSLFTDRELELYIVADGMGGHNSGEVASRMACEITSKNFKDSLTRSKKSDATQVMYGENNPNISQAANHLISAIRLANRVIYEASQGYSQNQGMGTTLVALHSEDNHYHIAWVGDSRIYLFRHGHLQQLTVDHSLVQEQVDKGLISSADAEQSEFKNILTRALGTSEDVKVDTAEIEAFDDDYLLLCSDGLTRMVPDDKISEILKSAENCEEITTKLIELAKEAGGRDNITVIILQKKSENFWKKFLKSVAKTV
ncbi:MAG: Stp1/IreP family PP2C-type Ser/Thr phosphatase [Endomicrobiales bacterium]|nr:Stp1/IreP family PP2C-type Ser/Thr phosphatase [Endomicrobiales bacterium]